jgi:hypothetical protein
MGMGMGMGKALLFSAIMAACGPVHP